MKEVETSEPTQLLSSLPSPCSHACMHYWPSCSPVGFHCVPLPLPLVQVITDTLTLAILFTMILSSPTTFSSTRPTLLTLGEVSSQDPSSYPLLQEKELMGMAHHTTQWCSCPPGNHWHPDTLWWHSVTLHYGYLINCYSSSLFTVIPTLFNLLLCGMGRQLPSCFHTGEQWIYNMNYQLTLSTQSIQPG